VTDEFVRPGATLAERYEITRAIGRGGMAVVYLAHDRKLNRPVALKILRPELAATLGTDRFLREIDIAAKLTHPNIVALFDCGEADGFLYFAMPYIEGHSLRERLNRERRLPIDDAVRITCEVADALGYAHSLGIVHRDIKPENILFEAGHAVVADFGIARALSSAGEGSDSSPGIAIGTVAYMSPEQAGGHVDIDARSDLYSLGCVLYEMLAGEPPYGKGTPQALLWRKAVQPVRRLRDARHSLPAILERIVERALAREPGRRFATAEEFGNALRGGLATGTQGTRLVGNPPPTSVAVLPFVNMSPDPDNVYLSDGIAEEITNALTKIKGLRVASRTSAFAFKGRDLDVRRIGEDLAVATVLAGSVRKAGSRLRITAQLINVEDGYQLWSDRFDREAEDVFAIQDEIARNVAGMMKVLLTEDQAQSIVQPPTVHIQAYECYLRGRYFLHRFQKHSVRHAREMFERAIEIDPDYALAYAGAADCSSFLYMYFDGSVANLTQAEDASRRALELDPDLAGAHAARGLAVALGRRYDEAEAEFEKAIQLDATSFEPYYFYARTCFQQGKFDQAVQLFEKAFERREDYQARLLAALAYQGLGRNAEAKAGYEKALEVIGSHLELHPGDARALTLGACCFARLGRGDEAVDWCRRALDIDPDDPVVVYAVACTDAILGRRDEALERLERAVKGGFGNRKWIQNDPDFASLRDDPRFRKLVGTP
jgi:serine/threonine protein kinase/tetratricopeptide (TPR) repeat protein